MNYSNIYLVDTINGEGLRVSLFVSGCTRHCKGCFNKETWDFNHGERFTEEKRKEIIETIFKSSIEYSGLSLLGGEPLDNIKGLMPLVRSFDSHNEKLNLKKNIWLWSGYTTDEILNDTCKRSFVFSHVDYIVAGPFIEEQKDLTLLFRGSSNQHIYKVNKETETFDLIE